MSDLRGWLKGLGLEKFVDTFAVNEVHLDDLPLLSDADLRDLGIPLGPRRRLQKALEERRLPQQYDSAVPSKPLLPPGERRQVAVLFADLSGFTRLSLEVDAEEVHWILNQYFAAVDSIIRRCGGLIDKHIGDEVMAVFGAPVAHTDDPLRAVRAACDIHEAMQKLGVSVGREMTAHIGIASGQVVASSTGSDDYNEYTMTGEVVAIASRLVGLAGPGETLISTAVQDAVSRVFRIDDRGEMATKGLEAPIRVWAVQGLEQAEAGGPAGALFGRQMELRQFLALVETCSETGRGGCLMVRGDPGIGKTRLVEEFAAEARGRGFETLRSLVLDFGTSHGEGTIRSLALDMLALRPVSGVEEREAKLEAAIARGVVSGAGRVFATELLGIPRTPDLASLYEEMDSAAREAGSREVLAELLSARVAETPLLLVVEDVHWADRVTLDHIAYLASQVAGMPALLVITTRHEGAAMERNWLSTITGAPLSVMELQPLRASDAFDFASSQGNADGQQVEAVVTRAGGNPLYLELLMRNMGEAASARLPDTLQGLVLARVDRLAQRDKAALQAGSVAGQKLSLDLLRHLVSDSGYDCGPLIEHRLLKRDGEHLLFAHALIRDGVYESLLRDRRHALHRRAAEWFSDRDVVLRAEHLDRAQDPDAVPAYLEAARAEAADHRAERALELLHRGVELLPNDVSGFAFHYLEGELLEALSRFEEAAAAFRTANAEAASEKDRCRALLGQALAMLRLDRHNEAEVLLDEAAAIAGASKLIGEQAIVHRRKATIAFARGYTQQSFDESAAALAMAEDCGLTFLKAEALSCMADAEAAAGRFVSARSCYTRCIELCRQHGFRRFAIINAKMLGDSDFYRGEMGAAHDSFTQVVEDAAELRDLRSEILARGMLTYLHCLAGEHDAALEQVALVRDQILRIDLRRFLMNNDCLAAMALRIRGDRDGALARLADAEQLGDQLGVVWAMPWVLGERALALSPGDDRDACLDRGMELLAAGKGGYFTFEFYRPAIEAAIDTRDWARAERLTNDFSETMGKEPVGLSEYVIARARALINAGRGKFDVHLLDRLRARACEMGIFVDLAAIDAALDP